MNRLEIYTAMRVPEVWRYNGETRKSYRLIDNEYYSKEASEALPLLQRSDILRFLRASKSVGETTWIQKFCK